MDRPFKEKLCVVTGAASGIGRAIALNLAQQGAALALSDRDLEGLEETRRLIGGASNRIRIDVLDVADAAAIETYAETIRESLGVAEAVLNVAGLSRIGRFEDTPLGSMETVMDVNYWGVVRICKAFLPQLIETKGRIVNISSLFGLIGVGGQTHYCSSKFAVRGFSEALAAELEDSGVSVTSVHPGGVATPIAANAEVDALPPGVECREELIDRFSKVARTSPERAAEVILRGAAKRRRRVMVGPDSRVVSFVQRMVPSTYARLLKPLFSPTGR